MSLAMELRLESVASCAQSVRSIAFRSASTFNSRMRFVSQPHGFRDQSHVLFYQSPVCKHSEKAARTAMAEIASDIASIHIEQDLLQQLENLKLQMKEKKRELKQHRKALKAAAKTKKSDKKMGASMSSSSSESSDSDEEDCNTFDMRALRKKEEARIVKERHLAQETVSSATIDSSEDLPTELNSCLPSQEITVVSEPVELNSCSCSQNMPIVLKSIEAKQCVSSQNVSIESKPCFQKEETLAASERIEVCVGGSCRKAGSKTLLGSLQERIPANSGACAVACKCMGRCDKSINVRIVKDEGRPQFHSHAQVDDADWLLRHRFGAEILPIHLPSLDTSNEGELTPMASLAT